MNIALSRHSIKIFILIFVAVALPRYLYARGQINALVEDFRPIVAAATQKDSGEFVLDKGSSSHIKPGDLFSLVGKGRPIYVPGSRRILGYQEKVVAKCKVVEVKRDLSICKVYYASGQLLPRLKALRFSRMKAALFLDGKLVSPVFSTYSLQKMLPNLVWLKPASGPMPVPTKSSMEAFGIDLVFDLKDDTLNVYGPDMREISSYKVASAAPVLSESTGKEQEHVTPGIEQAPVSFDFAKAATVGTLSGRVLQVAVTDLDEDGREEIIYLTEKELGVAPYHSAGQPLFYRFGDFECPCSFSYSKGWLVLNVAIKSAGLTSKLFSYRKGRLHLVQDEINLWLSFVRSECRQKRPLLLGQEYEKERFRGERIFRLNPTGNGLEYVEQVEFPGDFNVDSATTLDANGTCLLLYVSFDGFFKVFGSNTHLWTSLFPVVPERPCCGPGKANFLKLGDAIVFNGVIPGEKGKGESGLYYFSLSKGFYFLRADSNLTGSICGVSKTSKGIIIGVTDNTKEGWKTRLYKFPIH